AQSAAGYKRRPLIMRYAWPLRGAHRPIRHDCEDDRILRFTRNETRSLSLMSRCGVNSGAKKLNARRVYAVAIRLNLGYSIDWQCRAPRSQPYDAAQQPTNVHALVESVAPARVVVDRAQERRKSLGERRTQCD